MSKKYSITYNTTSKTTTSLFKIKSFVSDIYDTKLTISIIYNKDQAFLINPDKEGLSLIRLNTIYKINGFSILIKEINIEKDLLRIGIVI